MFPTTILTAALLAALPVALQDAPPAEPAAAEAAAQGEMTAESLLEQVEHAAEDMATLRCRVRYTKVQGALADEQQRFGTVYYAAPNEETNTRFAIHLDRLVMDDRLRPIEQWFVYDGRWLLERNVDRMTATRRELRTESEAAQDADTIVFDSQSVPIPLRLKKDDVLRDYTVTLLDDETLGDWTLHHLRLTPKPDAEGNTDRIPMDMWFDSATLLLAKVYSVEGEDTTELLFAPNAMEPNAELAPGTFDTSLPDPADGWEVQEVPLESNSRP